MEIPVLETQHVQAGVEMFTGTSAHQEHFSQQTVQSHVSLHQTVQFSLLYEGVSKSIRTKS